MRGGLKRPRIFAFLLATATEELVERLWCVCVCGGGVDIIKFLQEHSEIREFEWGMWSLWNKAIENRFVGIVRCADTWPALRNISQSFIIPWRVETANGFFFSVFLHSCRGEMAAGPTNGRRAFPASWRVASRARCYQRLNVNLTTAWLGAMNESMLNLWASSKVVAGYLCSHGKDTLESWLRTVGALSAICFVSEAPGGFRLNLVCSVFH